MSKPYRLITRAGKMVYEVTGWSVVFTTGTCFFALQGNGAGGRSFFRRKQDALVFKRELAQHGMASTAIRAVKVRMETTR